MKKITIAIVTIAACAAFAALYAAEVRRTATIKSASGTVEVKKDGKWVPATSGMTLNQGESIRTLAGSGCLINVDGNGETASVEVKGNSQMTLSELVTNKAQGYQRTFLDLSLGQILIKAKKLHSAKSKFEVKTPTSIVGVRGTTFAVSVEAVE